MADFMVQHRRGTPSRSGREREERPSKHRYTGEDHSERTDHQRLGRSTKPCSGSSSPWRGHPGHGPHPPADHGGTSTSTITAVGCTTTDASRITKPSTTVFFTPYAASVSRRRCSQANTYARQSRFDLTDPAVDICKAPADHQSDRVDVRHGAPPHESHQGARFPRGRACHGFQAH
jgi:hypothetical protein